MLSTAGSCGVGLVLGWLTARVWGARRLELRHALKVVTWVGLAALGLWTLPGASREGVALAAVLGALTRLGFQQWLTGRSDGGIEI